MRKYSWSDKKKNDIVYYYALEGKGKGGAPLVMVSEIPMSSTVARQQVNKQYQKNKEPLFDGEILAAQLDLSSGRIYLPETNNLNQVEKNPDTNMMLQAIRLNATKTYGNLPDAAIILGDPFKLIRVRHVEDFSSGAKFIKAHLQEEGTSSDLVNLPVIEADLSKMPQTLKSLPKYRDNLQRQGGLISDKEISAVVFEVPNNTGGGQGSRQIHIQKTPFILINTAQESRMGDADKERVVITGYKEFCTMGVTPGLVNSSGKYTIKYLIYMGYPFRNLCESMITVEDTVDFPDMITKGMSLVRAARDLAKSGYEDPAKRSTYYAFNIGSDFPVRFQPQMQGAPYDQSNQPEIFTIVHYDTKTDTIVFKTPLYLSDEILAKILKASGEIIRCEYDPYESCIKTDEPPSRLFYTSQLSADVIKQDIQNTLDFERSQAEKNGEQVPEADGPLEFKERQRIEALFQRRKISDFYQVTDRIKEIINKLNTEEKNVEFNDIPVVTGPWSQMMGFEGGYTNMDKIRRSGTKLPMKLFPSSDWELMPPFIMIDNQNNPSVADQAHIVIHEYRHHINDQIGVHSPDYDMTTKPKSWKSKLSKDLNILPVLTKEKRIFNK